jgi:co-chaperonin GroES (HSP10)|tara:strand:+ start:47 stop:454 length:408 start_codon:yes stop_codon:yes gene_type:complete
MTFRAIIWMMTMTDIDKEVTEEELENQLPTPVGYRVLVAMPEVEDTYGESGIIKSSKEVQMDTVMSTIGLVLDMGSQAYSDKERFPTGPWCKQGDYVMFRMNTGTRFKVNGVEYRLMNDDSIEAVVSDPRGVTRV